MVTTTIGAFPTTVTNAVTKYKTTTDITGLTYTFVRDEATMLALNTAWAASGTQGLVDFFGQSAVSPNSAEYTDWIVALQAVKDTSTSLYNADVPTNTSIGTFGACIGDGRYGGMCVEIIDDDATGNNQVPTKCVAARLGRAGFNKMLMPATFSANSVATDSLVKRVTASNTGTIAGRTTPWNEAQAVETWTDGTDTSKEVKANRGFDTPAFKISRPTTSSKTYTLQLWAWVPKDSKAKDGFPAFANGSTAVAAVYNYHSLDIANSAANMDTDFGLVSVARTGALTQVLLGTSALVASILSISF